MELFLSDESGISGLEQDSQHQHSGPEIASLLLHSGAITTCTNQVAYVTQ